jgi:hypothetical protein
MRAEVALGGSVAVGIDVERIVGASLHAAFATDTAAIVEIYDSIRTAEEGVGGTNLNAGSIVAVVTSHHAEVASGLGELAGLHVFHPRSKNSDGDLVFLLARHRTGVTADTSVLVDNKPVAHKGTAVAYISLPKNRRWHKFTFGEDSQVGTLGARKGRRNPHGNADPPFTIQAIAGDASVMTHNGKCTRCRCRRRSSGP